MIIISLDKVKNFFKNIGLEDRIKVLDDSTATVELAAKAVGCEIKQIAKSMTFLVKEKPVMIVCAGNVKIDNSKYKSHFHEKAKMIPASMLEEYIGHNMGGVCPFAIKNNVAVYLDESLKANEIVYPPAGNEHSAVKLTLNELEQYSNATMWVDVCKEI